MPLISVVNKSTLLSDADVNTMTVACDIQVASHLAPSWGISPIPVLFNAASSNTWTITVLDDSDQAGALGYHSDDNNVIGGKVFVREALDHGSSAFQGEYAISSILSHEVLELVVDPTANSWSLMSGNNFVCREVCDPCEDQYYVITAQTSVGSIPCNVSNFVTPAWFNPHTTARHTDILRMFSKPLVMSHGGYVVTWLDGQGQQQQFGESMPDWRKQTKRVPGTRGFLRATTPVQQQSFR